MSAYEALRTDAAAIDLSRRGKIRVSGEDRARLLHAMSTNHVQGLAENAGLYTFFLNAQGRILADAYLINLGESILIDTEPELREKLHQHLDKYVIADDVVLEDETDTWATIDLEGPNSFGEAAALGIPVPDDEYGVARWNEALVLRMSVTGLPGLRIVTPTANRDALLQTLDCPQADAGELEIVRLEQGTPRYGQDLTERFLVQETGVLRAVHFSKGCYLGQEIVERVRSRAQIHRHLKAIRIETQIAIAPGTKLTKNGQSAGEITSAAFSPAWNAVASLGYVRTDAAEPDSRLVVADTEPPVLAEVL